MVAESASHMRVHLVAFHVAKQQQPNGYRSMSEAVREKAGCLRNVEGMERERVCGRQELVNAAWGQRSSMRHWGCAGQGPLSPVSSQLWVILQ